MASVEMKKHTYTQVAYEALVLTEGNHALAYYISTLFRHAAWRVRQEHCTLEDWIPVPTKVLEQQFYSRYKRYRNNTTIEELELAEFEARSTTTGSTTFFRLNLEGIKAKLPYLFSQLTANNVVELNTKDGLQLPW